MESTGASAERGLTSHRQDATGDDFAAAAIAVGDFAVAVAVAVPAAIAASAAAVLCICEKKIFLLEIHKKS